MTTSAVINHKIQLKSNQNELMNQELENVKISPNDWIYMYNACEDDEEFKINYLWGSGYYESMIGTDRSMTKEEYKKFMHDQRHESWEFDKNHDNSFSSEYEPQYNPGGGPYNPNDNI